MTDALLSADILLTWHEAARAVAFLLLGGLALLALFQFAAANQHSAIARLSRRHTLRSQLFIGLALVGTIPVLALMLILTERSAHLRLERMSERLEQSSASMAFAIDRFLDKHIAGIESVAATISASGDYSQASSSESLMRHHAVYTEFLTMLTTDRNGFVVAVTNSMSGTLTTVENVSQYNVSDREYFTAPMATGQPFISSPFRGRGIGQDALVAFSAPIRDQAGKLVGVVEASMDLSEFEDIDSERSTADGAVMIVLDRKDQVVFASGAAGLSLLDSLAGTALVNAAATRREREVFDFEDDVGGNRYLHMGVFSTTDNGWRVFIRIPVHQVTTQMLGDYRVGGLLLILACAISLLLARAIVRRVAQGIRDINGAIKSFSFDGADDQVKTPANTAKEFRPLFRAMRARSKNLRTAHARLSKSIDAGEALRRELTQAVALRDVEIAERTAELEEANERLSGLSKTDALTGIANRREFDAFEGRAWRIAARDKTPVAVILIDIDFFKIYNDSLGHQAGDDCLREVAQVLATCATRPLDLVARFGGEEFVAVLGGSTIHDALVVAERMRGAVQGLRIEHPGSSHDVVTVSVGIASMVPCKGQDSETVIKAADEALYYAKAAGRNCVVFRRDDEYVTYNADDIDLGATGVIQILAGKRA